MLCAGLAEFIASGSWDVQLARARALYTEKMKTLCDSVEEHCGEWVEFERPAGGFYLWLRIRPAGLTAASVHAAAMDEGLVTRDGLMYFQYETIATPPGDVDVASTEHIRLCFSQPSLANLRASGPRLAAAFRKLSSAKLQ